MINYNIGDMEAEDIQRLRGDSKTRNIRGKQNEIGTRINKICDDLQTIRNAVIHVRNYDSSTETKLDAILKKITVIENMK